jgi:DNA-binding NarL/FixJ family response regulator
MRENPVKRKILIVEDEPFLREMLCKALDSAGFHTFPASTAIEASRIFSMKDPDGALIDIDLGNQPNGVVLAARFRRSAPNFPIVFLTGLTDPRVVEGPGIPSNSDYVVKTKLNNVDQLVAILDGSLRGASKTAIRHDQSDLNPLAVLTSAQVNVLRLIAEGLSNEQIAETRGTTLRATEVLVSKTLTRLGIDKGTGNRRVQASRVFGKIV